MLIDLKKIKVGLDAVDSGGRALIASSNVSIEDLAVVVPDLQCFVTVRKAAGNVFECGVILESEEKDVTFTHWFMPVLPPTVVDEDDTVRFTDLLECLPDLLVQLCAVALVAAIAPHAKLYISYDASSSKPVSLYLTIHEHTPQMFEASDSFTDKELADLLVESSEFDPVNQ